MNLKCLIYRGNILRVSLETRIECVREQMKRSASIEGINAPRTIKLSEKLDRLLNQYDMEKEKSS